MLMQLNSHKKPTTDCFYTDFKKLCKVGVVCGLHIYMVLNSKKEFVPEKLSDLIYD